MLWLGLPVLCWIRGKSRHPCLVPDLKGNACMCFLLSMMMVVGLSYMAFIMFRYVLSIPNLLRVFIIKGCLISSNAFYASLISCGFYTSFCFLCGESHLLICECCTNFGFPEEIPLDSSIWSFWCITVFSLLIFYWRLKHLCSSGILAYIFLFCIVFIWLWN